MRVELKASEWARGPGSTLLCSQDRTRCCLGVDAEAYGVLDRMLEDEAMPEALPAGQGDFSEWSRLWMGRLLGAEAMPEGWWETVRQLSRSRVLAERKRPGDLAAIVNDAGRISDEERVRLLTPLFALMGRELVWLPDE